MRLVAFILIASTMALLMLVPTVAAVPTVHTGPQYYGASFAEGYAVRNCSAMTHCGPTYAAVGVSGVVVFDPTPWGADRWTPYYIHGGVGILIIGAPPVGLEIDPPFPDVDGGPPPPDCVPNCDVGEYGVYGRRAATWARGLP